MCGTKFISFFRMLQRDVHVYAPSPCRDVQSANFLKGETMGMMKEFKEFAIKGKVMDLAVGVIIGAAFGKIVDSVVKDLIMPVVGAVIGKIDFSSLYIKLAVAPAGVPDTLEALQKAGVPVFAYGNFITIVVNFLILAFVVFMLVKQFNRMKKEPPAELPATPEEIVLLRKIRDNLKK